MTDIDLAAIRARYERTDAGNGDALRPLALTDVPALLAEVERLIAELAEVDRLAQSAIRAEVQAVRQAEAERDAMRQVVDAAAPLIVGAKDSTAPRTDVFQRLIDVWDAYTAARAGQVEVPPTPTTDAEFEALPRLVVPEHGIPAAEALNLARYVAEHVQTPGTER